MRYLRYLVWGVIGVALVVIALANRQVVTLKLLPAELADLAGISFSIDVPLYVVMFAGIAIGVLLGFVWEWLREHKHRSQASKSTKQVARLEREVTRLKGEKHEGKDEVLALLEN
ncbi:LapA family protein [Algirhabdus cladophorae]|uniref:LapA family protein n=1 Tax=Algirhabdus cladophorae TaxID=3377108 RepID=UPI003B84739F